MTRIADRTRLVTGVAGVIAGLAATLAMAGSAHAIALDPATPLTGESVTLTATAEGTDGSFAWDLEGNGTYVAGDRSIVTTYTTTGVRKVVVKGPDGILEPADVSVGQLEAPFIFFPSAPRAGQELLIVATNPTAPSVPITSYAWDLNGDGAYGDKTGPAVLQTFAAAGSYRIGLRVTNADGAFGSSVQTVTVLAPGQVAVSGNALRLLSPFPVVRITGRVTHSGTRIRRLTVEAPLGAHVRIGCSGRGCPFRQTTRTVTRKPTGAGRTPTAAPLRVRRLERRLLRPAATLRVYVTAGGTVGKFTRFKIRNRKPPVRSDLCLVPNAASPAPCPSS